MPHKDHRPGTGDISIATGRGAEGFLTDARVGRIRDAMTPYLAREEYGSGLARGVDLIAQAFAQEFGVSLTGVPEAAPGDGVGPFPIPVGWIVVALVVLIVLSRGRVFLLPLWFGGQSPVVEPLGALALPAVRGTDQEHNAGEAAEPLDEPDARRPGQRVEIDGDAEPVALQQHAE